MKIQFFFVGTLIYRYRNFLKPADKTLAKQNKTLFEQFYPIKIR